MIELKGITWDHMRGINPLVAASNEFSKENPNVSITWDARSLEDFEDYPIDILAKKYDLIMLDHPFIGTGARKQVIEPLNDWISKEYLQNQEKNSVGGSFESYTWEGNQWALPIDAASQVAVYREDLLSRLGLETPSTLHDVDTFIQDLPSGYYIGIPLNPTHSFCSFISLSANISAGNFYKQGEGFNPEIGAEAIHYLRKWKEHAHSISIDSNPITMLEHMSLSNEIVYVPFIFGYSNYGRENQGRKKISFTNIPTSRVEASGSILGGVGLALSTHSNYKKEAVNFMEYVASEACQCGVYVEHDGQPAFRKAWLQTKSNEQTNNFFQATLESIDLSYTRPRYYGYVEFQRQAGELIHNFLKQNKTDVSSLMTEINKLHQASLGKELREV